VCVCVGGGSFVGLMGLPRLWDERPNRVRTTYSKWIWIRPGNGTTLTGMSGIIETHELSSSSLYPLSPAFSPWLFQLSRPQLPSYSSIYRHMVIKAGIHSSFTNLLITDKTYHQYWYRFTRTTWPWFSFRDM
jgi:hypothetical protein